MKKINDGKCTKYYTIIKNKCLSQYKHKSEY